MAKDRYGVSAIAFLIIRDDEVLMEQCPKKKIIHGADWFIPGGKIEADETQYKALCREVWEELGVVVSQATPLPVVDCAPAPPGFHIMAGGHAYLNDRPVADMSTVEIIRKLGPITTPYLMRPFITIINEEWTVPSHNADGIRLDWFSISDALCSPCPQIRAMVAMAMMTP